MQSVARRLGRGRLGRGAALMGVAGLGLALQGCGMSSITSGLGGGILGGGGAAGGSAPKGLNDQQLIQAAKSETEVQGAIAQPGCPQMLIWASEKNLTVHEAGRVGDGLAIIYQGQITKVARECEFTGSAIVIKYGFSGRLLIGPRGQPGVVQLPVQVFITDGSRERVQTETMKVDVTIPPDTPISYFSTVRTVTLPVREGIRPADYKLFVGFDKVAPEATGPAAATPVPGAKGAGKKKG